MSRSDKMLKGLEKAPHHFPLFALGLTREEMNRPLIGVVDSANEIIPGHMHLDTIAQAVKDGIRMAGGTPMEFPTIGVCDGLAMNHEGMRMSLPSRELIADSIEISATAVPFDGLVFIPNCDKIVPGMLMAMLRLKSRPSSSAAVPCCPAASRTGKAVDLITVFEGVGKVKTGAMTEAELETMEECACPGCGSCAGMFTANSMNCLSRGHRPGSARRQPFLPTSARIRLAKQAGMQVMTLVKKISGRGTSSPPQAWPTP